MSESTTIHPPVKRPPEWEDDFDGCGCGDEDCPECGGRNCWSCGGDGWVDGAELADEDPFWYDENEFYKCPNCGGSGDGKDCTYW